MTLDRLLRKLGALAAKRRRVAAALGVSALIVAAVLLAFATAALDYWLRLPTAVRVVHALLCAGLLGRLLWKRLATPLLETFGVEDAAIAVEKSVPALNDRLISLLQLRASVEKGEGVASEELVRDAEDRALADLENVDFSKAIDAGAAGKPLLFALVSVVVAGAAAIAAPEETSIFVRRCLLFQDAKWPRATTLELTVVDGERFARFVEDGREVFHVPERTPLQIRVDVRGVVPSTVELVAAPVDGGEKPRVFAMGRPGGKDYFQHIFPPLSHSLVLHAVGGDDDDADPKVEIRVSRAPRITRSTTLVTPPAYTGAPPRTATEANLAAPEGSGLAFRFETNIPLESFELVFDKAGVVKLAPDPEGAYVHETTLDQSDFYTYRLKGGNGVLSTEAPRYVLTAEPDQVPRVQMDMPAQTTMFASPRAVIPIRGVATDDYGVTSIETRWTSDGETLLNAIPLAGGDLLKPVPGPQIPFYRDLSLSDFGDLKTGGRARFKLLVSDNRKTTAQPEPHRQFGDYEYSIQVLEPADVERELIQRQTRLRDRVRELVVLAESRLSETAELLRAPEGDLGAAFAARLAAVETGQNRITVELNAAGRQFMRVFEGYLYNRLDQGNLTEKLLVVLSEIYRSTTESDPYKTYGEALNRVRAQASEGELMGRLTVILDLFVKTAAEKSPEAVRLLAKSGLSADANDRSESLRGAKAVQESLVEDLRALEDKLEAWEDYMDVIQGLRDLIELQQGVKGKAERLTK
jgi:hypothetical protein